MVTRDRLMAPRRARRRSVWVNVVVNVESLGATTQIANTVDLNRQVANADGLTVVRSINSLWFGSDTAGGRGRLSAGLTLVNADANAANALPDTNAQPEEADWLWLAPENFHKFDADAGPTRGHISADVKSKRKYGQGDILSLILFNSDATNGLDISGYVRSLLLLP